ncbi:MAG: hypothetical protein DWG80_06715 [Chloroflexi bacterium]|nr:hypothetical protein [Chloroflexota bacterium]
MEVTQLEGQFIVFTANDLPEEMLREESRTLSERRSRLESERMLLPMVDRPAWDLKALESRMPSVLAAIQAWLVKADGDDLDLLLRAVDVSAKASRERVEISGSVPMIDSSDYANLVTIERTSA